MHVLMSESVFILRKLNPTDDKKKRKKSYKILAVYDKHNILPNGVIEQESRTQKKVKISKNIIKRITYSYRV